MRKLLLMFVFLTGFVVCSQAQDSSKPPAPTQPIPFDHKQHATTAKMGCNDCHESRGDGTTLAMPQAPRCMTCHASVAADKPDIQRLAAAAKNEEPIAWVRVYRVPGFVTFSHKTHAESKCEECHGPVAERTAIALEKDTHMGTCIACHSAKGAPTGCDTCHALQSKNGRSPFDVNRTMLAQLQLASAGRISASSTRLQTPPSARSNTSALAFLRAPVL